MQVVNIKTDRGQARLTYVVAVLNKHPYCIEAGVEFAFGGSGGIASINYGGQEDEGFIMPVGNSIFKDLPSEQVMNAYIFKGKKVYSVESETRKEEDFISGRFFAFDVFETIFFHLSRYEEVSIHFADYLTDRLAFECKLLLVRSGLEKVPVVDELILAFLEVVTGRKIVGKGVISLSHDIDYIRKFKSPLSIIRKVAGHLRHRKSLKGFPVLWKSYLDYLLRGKDGFDTFDWMLSEKDVVKTVYFLVGGSHKEDNQYDLKGDTFLKAIRLAKERNYRIGIHPSYKSWNRLELIKEEKEKLECEVGEEIVLSRQHFLNFDIEKTPQLLENLGIKEDSSLGYTRHLGYRCGTGFPFLMYDFANEKAFDVVERPMVFMDVAYLFEGLRTGNMNLPNLEKYYGDFLFHNSTFDEMEVRGIRMKEHYLKFFG